MAHFISQKAHRVRMARKVGMILLLIGIMVFSGVTVFAKRSSGEEALVAQSSKKCESDKELIEVFKAKENLLIGTIANSKDFEVYKMTPELITEDTVMDVSELKNRRLARTLMKNDVLKKADLIESDFFFKSADRLIEQSFPPEGIPSACKEGSIIDIRLFKADGGDPVVISKVFVIKRLEYNLTMYMDMKEQELLKQAIKEGNLYILLYADPNQEASMVDYIPDYTMDRLVQ